MTRSLLIPTLAFALACAAAKDDGGTDDAGTTGASSTAADDSASTSAATTDDDTGDDGQVDDGSGDGPQDESSSGASTGAATDDTTADDSTSTGGSGIECDPLDMYEPNDDVSESHYLGTIGDDDDMGGTLVAGLEGDEDIDWYRYIGNDDAGSVVDSTRTVDASGAIRLCKYIACTDGPADLDACPEGSVSGSTDTGAPGCCVQNGSIADFTVAFNCPGVSDDATIYISIDSGPADICTAYTMDFHY
jgi:hypothetical protein